MKLLDLLWISGFLQLSRTLIQYVQNFIDLYILHFAVESTSKHSWCILWKMALLEVDDFQNGNQYWTLRNVSINFFLFYCNNIMSKTDIMLDYWYCNYIAKRMHNNCGEIFSGFCRKPVRNSESVWTTCCEINEFEAHFFPIYQRLSWEWARAWGRWCGWGRREGGGEGVGHIRV